MGLSSIVAVIKVILKVQKIYSETLRPGDVKVDNGVKGGPIRNSLTEKKSFSAGGVFGLGWLRDMCRLPDYVEEANRSKEFLEELKAVMKWNKT